MVTGPAAGGAHLTSIPQVVAQHADEAAFLWLLRDRAVRSPAYALKDLAALDERVDAHLDGLRVAADAGWELAVAGLANGEAGETFCAALLAVEPFDEARFRAVLAAVAAEPECWRGLASALAWIPAEAAAEPCRRLLDGNAPARAAALRALSKHAYDPGSALSSALSNANPLLRRAALRCVGELRRVDCEDAARTCLNDGDAECRLLAALALALLSRSTGLPTALELATTPTPLAERAADAAVRIAVHANEAAGEIASAIARAPGNERAGIAAAAALGDPIAVPTLIELCAEPALARFAAGAITEITGVDLALLDLDGAAPPELTEVPNEDPADERTGLDPDLERPWPDSGALSDWWAKRRGDFARGVRHVHGRPADLEGLRHALLAARQDVRAHAALDLALATRTGLPFDTEARGARQRQRLGVGGGKSIS